MILEGGAIGRLSWHRSRRATVEGSGPGRCFMVSGNAVVPRCIVVNEAPPNKGMHRTAKSVTLFARAEAAPLFSAADPRR